MTIFLNDTTLLFKILYLHVIIPKNYKLGEYMLHDFDYDFDFSTNILEAGAYFTEPATNPERLPIHLATAHNVNDLDDLQKRYDEKGFCYNRYRNPNRSALNRLTAYNRICRVQSYIMFSYLFHCGII